MSTEQKSTKIGAGLRVVSGGQAGADRGALQAALDAGTSYGGWVPRGRRAEDGQVPACFDQLREHPSGGYPIRTRANVCDSDGTVVFAKLPASGGSALTIRLAREEEKPLVVFDGEQAVSDMGYREKCLEWLSRFCWERQVHTLNVAGSRESRVPGIQNAVRQIVRSLLVLQPECSSLGYWICEDCGTMNSVRNWRCGCGGRRAPF